MTGVVWVTVDQRKSKITRASADEIGAQIGCWRHSTADLTGPDVRQPDSTDGEAAIPMAFGDARLVKRLDPIPAGADEDEFGRKFAPLKYRVPSRLVASATKRISTPRSNPLSSMATASAVNITMAILLRSSLRRFLTLAFRRRAIMAPAPQ
jgi:hypothetical protein